eukprot:g54180.t1
MWLHVCLASEEASSLRSQQFGIENRCVLHAEVANITAVVAVNRLEEIRPKGWLEHLGFPWVIVTDEMPADVDTKHVQKKLRNFFKEGSGYLEYIIANYDCLPTRLAFIHAHRDATKHITYTEIEKFASPTNYFDDMADTLSQLCWEKVTWYLPLLNVSNRLWPGRHLKLTMSLLERFSTLNPKLMMSHEDEALYFFCCGSFVVHRDAILQHSKDWWLDLYAYGMALVKELHNDVDGSFILEFSWTGLLADRELAGGVVKTYMQHLRLNSGQNWTADLSSVDISSYFTCRHSERAKQIERKRHLRKKARLEIMTHRQRLDLLASQSDLATCARFFITGVETPQDRRLYTKESCTVTLEASWSESKDPTWQYKPQGLGECYPPYSPRQFRTCASYSSPDHACRCLNGCEQNLPVCCNPTQKTCQPCAQMLPSKLPAAANVTLRNMRR